MKGYLVTAGSLLLLATASCVFAWNGPGNYFDPEYAPGGYGGGYPMHHPFEYGTRSQYRIRVPRIYMEKARYEDGYLLRVHTEGIKAEDIEVLADRGRLRLSSDTSRQNEWQSEAPYRYSRSSRRSSISRTVPLPPDADASKLTTAVKDGVLEIRIPGL
ncbi:MAG: Hsp20/alpha crystallin family protein [Thiogranum sp.]